MSDTHMPRGARALPPRCIEELRAADAILHAGDFVTAGILEQIAAYGPPVHAVHGNVDSADLRARLPARATFRLGGAAFAVVHDPGPARKRLERLRAQFPEADVVVFGHTHMPEHAQRGGFQIFNPGSPTERRRAPSHSMGRATVESGGRVALDLVDLAG